MKIKISSNTANTFLFNQIIYNISVNMIYSPLTALSLPHLKKKNFKQITSVILWNWFQIKWYCQTSARVNAPPTAFFFSFHYSITSFQGLILLTRPPESLRPLLNISIANVWHLCFVWDLMISLPFTLLSYLPNIWKLFALY